MKSRDAGRERRRFPRTPGLARFGRIGFDDFERKPLGKRRLDSLLAVAPGEIEHARPRLQRAGQRLDQALGVLSGRQGEPPAARLSRAPRAGADGVERR